MERGSSLAAAPPALSSMAKIYQRPERSRAALKWEEECEWRSLQRGARLRAAGRAATQTVTTITATTCSIILYCGPLAARQHETHCGKTCTNTERKHTVSIIMNHSFTHSFKHSRLLSCSPTHTLSLARSLICSFTSSHSFSDTIHTRAKSHSISSRPEPNTQKKTSQHV